MLSERRIREAKPRATYYILWDARIKGLGCRINPAGSKTYVINYRTGGRQRRASIGRPSEISLAEARRRAARELDAIRYLNADPLERKCLYRDAPTLADAVDRFFTEYTPERIRTGRMVQRTEQTYRHEAGRYLLPTLARRRVRDITRVDIERTVGPLPPTTRNRVLAFASRLFTLTEDWGWRDQHTNPCRAVTRARLEARDRVLSADEMARLARALTEAVARHPGPVAAIRFAIVTGLRPAEVLGIEWAHLDMGSGTVQLKRARTGARSHRLPAPALDIITSQPEFNRWVFTTGGGSRQGPISYSHMRKVFAEACVAAGVKDARISDLRRGVMLAAAEAGADAAVLRDLLGLSSLAMADRFLTLLDQPVRQAQDYAAAKVVAMMAGDSTSPFPPSREFPQASSAAQ